MPPPLYTPLDNDDDPDPNPEPEPERAELVRMPQRQGAVVTGPATRGLGTMFADPMDVARYYTSKYRGESEQKALTKGDPGIGSPYLGEIDTSKAFGVAVPHETLVKTFGANPATWRTARAQLTHKDKTFAVPIIDIGPGKGPRGRGVVTDLSHPLWQALGLDPAQGLANVKIQLLGNAGPDYTSARADWDQEQAQLAQALQIPQFQAGGIVTEPTVALVGESGPEAIVPLPEPGVDPSTLWDQPQWEGIQVSPSQRYPRLYSPQSGWLAPLPISPEAGETGSQTFWRQSLTEAPLPPTTEQEASEAEAEFERLKERAELKRFYGHPPGTGDRPPKVPPTGTVPGTLDVPTKPGIGAFPSIGGMMQTRAPAQTQEAEQPLDIESLRNWLATASFET